MPIYSRRERLFFDFWYQGIRCREYTKLDDNSANRKRMQMLMDRIDAEILLRTFDYAKYFPNSIHLAKFRIIESKRIELVDGMPLFKIFTEIWFSENEIGWKHSYKATLRNSLDKHILPMFGAVPVSLIKKAEILSFRTGLAKLNRPGGQIGLSPARINHIMTPVRMILAEAADRYEFDTPYKNIKPLRVPKTQIDPFSFEDVMLIIANVRPDYRAFYTVRFLTGMRTGEIHGLKWKYIDFERRQILIRESFVMDRMTDTKTDSSIREIQMSDPVFEALQAQKLVSGKEMFVFSNSLGKPLAVHNVTKRVWYPILRFLGLSKRRPYQARHTAATLWLASGESPEWIARQLGHSSTEMLFRVYSRYVPNLTRQDGSAFAALLSEKLNQTNDN
jgi:integrase